MRLTAPALTLEQWMLELKLWTQYDPSYRKFTVTYTPLVIRGSRWSGGWKVTLLNSRKRRPLPSHVGQTFAAAAKRALEAQVAKARK